MAYWVIKEKNIHGYYLIHWWQSIFLRSSTTVATRRFTWLFASNGGGNPPHFTPQVLIIFSRKTPWVCWGSPTFLGNSHLYSFLLRDSRHKPTHSLRFSCFRWPLLARASHPLLVEKTHFPCCDAHMASSVLGVLSWKYSQEDQLGNKKLSYKNGGAQNASTINYKSIQKPGVFVDQEFTEWTPKGS